MSVEQEMTQPCWTCRRSYGGCPWSKNFQPVEGWEAKETQKNLNKKVIYTSFEITFCPLYQEDSSFRKFENRILHLLSLGIGKTATSIIMGVSVRHVSRIEKEALDRERAAENDK